jgi:hypothetical protein
LSIAAGGLGHAPRTAREAEPATLAAERDQLLGVALLTAYARKPVLAAAALQVRLEILLDVLRQRAAGLTAQCTKRRTVPLDEPAASPALGSFRAETQ